MIHSLHDRKEEEKKGKANNYYAGGEKSGLSIQSPEDVEGVINNARNQSS
jgi:hypothetical protein